MPTMTILNLVTILSLGMLVGTEFTVSAFINPVLYTLDPEARAASIRLFAIRLGRAMPFWYAFNLVLLITHAALRHRQPPASLLNAAAALWATVIILTLIFLVPINNRMMRIDQSISNSETSQHRRWETLHRFRIAALALATVLFLLSLPL
jgi:uncharacterized membrane protein